MSPSKKPSPPLPAPLPTEGAEGHHTCTRCPACGTEECKVLQDLGMTCETMCAASQAEGRRKSGRRPSAAA
jgi:hypothetical protein